MKVLTRFYAFAVFLTLVLALPPNVLADCRVNLSASVSGTTLTASADASSDSNRGIQLSIFADNFPVAMKSCPEFSGVCQIDPVQTPTLCWKTGVHHVFGTASCNGESNSPPHKTYEFSVNTTPTVSATFEQDPAYPNQKRGWIRVDYSFPNTGAPTEGNESRAIAVSAPNYFYRSTWADLQSMSGTWRAPIDLTCFKTGTYTVQVQAVACQSADGEYRATTTTNVTVYTTPTVSVSFEQGATGAESAIVVDYQFPNTGARTISVYMDGNMEGRADEHTLAASGTWRIPLNTTCLSGTHHLLAQAVACNQSDGSFKAEDQETATFDSKPEVSVTAGGLDPDTNSYPITVDYNFKNTAGPGQRRINLYQNGLFIYAWTNLTDVSGSVTTTTQGCGEVTAVAIACGNTNDPAYVNSATTQLPDDLCKADRTSCGMPGRPINWGSGDVSLTVPVFTIQQSPLPLSFDMTYHSSRPAYPSLAGEVAAGWTSTFNQTLRIIDSTRVYGVNENGLERLYVAGDDVVSSRGPFRFTSQTWNCAIPADVHETVEQDGDLLLLTDLAGTVRTFDANSGRWQSTADRWGNLIFATYDDNNNLISVTDSAGRVIAIVASGTTIQQMTLPNGAVWKFQYSGGKLTAIFDPLHTGATPWRTFTYQSNSSRLLTAMRDDAGVLIEGHTYDAQGRGLTSFLENNREMVALEYGQPSPGQTRVTHTIDATTSQLTIVTWQYIGGRYRALRIDGGCGTCGIISDTETHEYDDFGNLITITAADGSITRQTFDENGQILTRTQAAGTALERTVTWEYGLDGWPDLVTRMTQPAPIGTLVTTFDWTGLPITGLPRGVMTLPPTNSVLTTSITGKLVAGGPDTTLTNVTTFDTRHRLLSTDGPRTDVSDVTSISYFPDDDADLNRRGRTASVTNAVGLTVHYDAYDLYGTPTAMRDVNDVTTTTENDLRGRTTATTSQPVAGIAGESTAYRSSVQFDSRDRMTDTTSAGGNHVRYRYEDGTNLLLDTIVLDGSGNERERRHLTRNVIGAVVKDEVQTCSVPAATCSSWTTTRTESSVYDFHNRLTQIIHGDESKRRLFYDAMGRIAQEQDETHDTPNTTYGFDLLGRTTSMSRAIDTTNAVTTYGYSLDGSLVSVTDPNGNVTHYEFDDFGRLTKVNSPVTGVITHVYDAAGNPVSDTAANGAVTQSVYDALNRLTTQTSAMNGSSETVTWTYDSGSFGLGRLASMNDPSGATSWTYERRGLVTGEQRTIGTASYTTSYGYDANGSRTSIGYPSGRVVHYTFDYAAHPYSVTSGSTSIVTSTAYLPFGPLSQIVFGNGTTQIMAFDNRYQITENKLFSPSATIADYLYAHDASGDITQIHDATGSSYNRDFGYDGLHRLISANTGSSLWGTGTYHYDLMGNMTSMSLGTSRNTTFNYNGTTPLLASVTENGTNRSVTYDASGNEASVGSSTFTYSPRNRLSSGDGYTYLYDGRGLRTRSVRATPSPGQVDFVYSPEANLLSEPVTEQDYVWLGNRPVAQFDHDDLRFTAADHLGAPVLQTGGAASVLWRGEYEPYGSMQLRAGQSLHQPLRLPGQEASDEPGEREYNIQRWYRPNWGRYTQSDPLLSLEVAAGGRPDPSTLMMSQGLYPYASDSPVVNTDRKGLYNCYYSITAHNLICFPTEDSSNPVYASSSFVSGNNYKKFGKCRDCQNNPDRMDVRNQGPIPMGHYTIQPEKLFSTRRPLTPLFEMRRGGFQLHFCPVTTRCSEGCIANFDWEDWQHLRDILELEEGHNSLWVIY